MSDLQTIATRRNPTILKKLPIWKQIELNYYGGTDYNEGGYLFQHSKESDGSYKVRKKRAVLFNQLAPIVDLMVGFIFANKPTRANTKEIQYLIENASKRANIDNFMRSVAKWSLMFTTGVLVDSPQFNTDIIRTEQDRQIAGMNPYSILYKPERIRDFSVDSIGNLRWVLLDNTYIDNSDPTIEPTKHVVYRLWTIDTWTDYQVSVTGADGRPRDTSMVKVIAEGNHPIGYVPFRFVNWRDDDIDFVAESICEDIALINQSIYNSTSYMDEMLGSGTFKMLFYPQAGADLPPGVKEGMNTLGIVPFDGTLSKQPYFDGAKLEEVEPFIQAMRMYTTELLKKIGLDNDEEKAFVKSGAARRMDFEKVKTLLTAGAGQMEALEIWMYSTAQRWLGKDSKAEISYSKDFLTEDLDDRLARFSQMLMISPLAKKAAQKLMVSAAMGNELEVEEMAEIVKEIEKTEDLAVDIDQMVMDESNNNEQENNNMEEQDDRNKQ